MELQCDYNEWEWIYYVIQHATFQMVFFPGINRTCTYSLVFTACQYSWKSELFDNYYWQPTILNFKSISNSLDYDTRLQTVTNNWQGAALQERAESLSLLINLHVETNMLNVTAVIMYHSIWSSFSLNIYVYNQTAHLRIPTQYLYADQDGRTLMVNSTGSEPLTSTILHRHDICCDPTGTLFWRHNAFSLFYRLWKICAKQRGCIHRKHRVQPTFRTF